MSFLTKTVPRLNATAATRSILPLGPRAFHASAPRPALNETDRHKDLEDLHKEIDHHKNDQLNKQKEGKGHWKGELASQSEAALKADKDGLSASDEDMGKMQHETKHHAEKQHKENKDGGL
ncbi:hypothetical protein MMC14_004536 [Varicellaria rhodocarpa]|nr:hypothetical protein [Varicellaria rhodocarpa]